MELRFTKLKLGDNMKFTSGLLNQNSIKPAIKLNLNVSHASISKMTSRMRKVRGNIEDAARVSIYRFGLRVIRYSKSITPEDTGTLRNSAYVMIPKKNLKSTSNSIGYGDVVYAVEVHENPEYNHVIGEYKFFEKAVNRYKPDFVNFVGRNMKPMIRSGRIPNITPANDVQQRPLFFKRYYSPSGYVTNKPGITDRDIERWGRWGKTTQIGQLSSRWKR